MKSQSETELEAKVNLTKSETIPNGKDNWEKHDTELGGAFHCDDFSLCFHPRRLLLGSPPLGLDLPITLNHHRFCPGLLFGANPKGILQNMSILFHHAPLNLRLLFHL